MVFAAEPLRDLGFHFGIAFSISFVVERKDFGEIKAMDHFVQRTDDLAYLLLH